MKIVKILLADDHDLLRDGISALLSDTKSIEIVASVGSGIDVINFLDLHKGEIDIVLMDIKMPGLTGIEAMEIINIKHPELKVIALSMFSDRVNISKMLKAGASAYVLKNMKREELLMAISEVSEGRNYFSREASEVMLHAFMPGKKDILEIPGFSSSIELTARELQVLKLIAQQFTNKAIADKLFLSTRTVDSHRRNVLQKIGAKNTAGLVSFAYASGILESDSLEATKMVFN